MNIEALDQKYEQDFKDAIDFINKHLRYGDYQVISEKIAKQRNMKKSSAYQLIMKTKSRKRRDDEIFFTLLNEAKERSMRIGKALQ